MVALEHKGKVLKVSLCKIIAKIPNNNSREYCHKIRMLVMNSLMRRVINNHI
jgi:hypothetical protein